jgi:hypothetical protein
LTVVLDSWAVLGVLENAGHLSSPVVLPMKEAGFGRPYIEE